MQEPIIESLLRSPEPAIRYKLAVQVLGQKASSSPVKKLCREVRASPIVKALLSGRDRSGRIPGHPYSKWVGSHWVLACLADLGYPPGDRSLKPLLEDVYGWLLSEDHARTIRTIAGRTRAHASQEGNALHATAALGLMDGRAEELAERLMRWQWPDGGWNCDSSQEAVHSSFTETLIPLRGLAAYACATGDKNARNAAQHAAEVFLKRELFKKLRSGAVIKEEFVTLHYPCYWHYDILFGLKVMAEAGSIGDRRCRAALDLLESKRLPDGGFPAEARFYRLSRKPAGGRSLVDWGPTSRRRRSDFVTVDALHVLRAAGRLHA